MWFLILCFYNKLLPCILHISVSLVSHTNIFRMGYNCHVDLCHTYITGRLHNFHSMV